VANCRLLSFDRSLNEEELNLIDLGSSSLWLYTTAENAVLPSALKTRSVQIAQLTSQVGRRVTITLEATAHIKSEVTAELTAEERTFLERFHEWLRRNWTQWTLSSIELGFPSGITFVFTRGEKKAKSKVTPKTLR